MNNLSVPLAAPPRSRPKPVRRRLQRLLLVLAVLVLAAWAAWPWVDQGMPLPVAITIDGEPVIDEHDIAALPPTDKAALAFGIALAAVLVPLALSAALFAAVLALLVVLLIAALLPLMLGSVVVMLALSPLLVVVWLVWRCARARPPSAPSDRMPA